MPSDHHKGLAPRCFGLLALVVSGCLLPTARASDVNTPVPPSTHTTAFSATVDKIVTAEILKVHIPSVTVAVLQNGKVLHLGAYGLAHLKPDVVPTPSTVYLLDSMTKQFTAAGIMLLVQEGRLDLDKPVRTYVPFAPSSWDAITIRHLLTHTAGLPHDPRWGYPSIKIQNTNPDNLLKHYVFNQHLRSKPGQKEFYSNTGYVALGAILEKVSGQPYAAFMQDRIFGPVGMTSTTIDFDGGGLRPGALGYDYDTSSNKWTADVEFYQPLAAAAIQSNALDLAKWDAALRTDTILTQASKSEMWKSYVLSNGKPASYGLGWIPETVGAQRLVWHNGGGWGFNNAFYRYLDSGLTVIVLTNLELEQSGTTHADDLATQIAAAYDPALTAPAKSGSAPGAAKRVGEISNTRARPKSTPAADTKGDAQGGKAAKNGDS